MSGYLATQAVDLAVAPDSSAPNERYELKDEIALRNSTRSVGCTGPGAPAQLVFTTQPSGAVAGAAFSTSPVVTAEDGAGNVITSYSGTVALSIKSGTGTSGAVLTGCSAVNVNGATTFTGCKIDKPGSGYVLVAADGTFTVESSPFDVVPMTDPSPPTFAITQSGANVTTNGTNAVLFNNVTGSSFTITASDPESGIGSTTFPACPAGWTTSPGANSVTCNDSASATAGSMAVSATNNANATTNLTVTITLDNTGPTNSLSLGASPVGAFMNGTTIYYKGNAPGSFTVVNAVSDAGSGPASATFPAIATTSWAHNVETVSTPLRWARTNRARSLGQRTRARRRRGTSQARTGWATPSTRR